MSPLSLEGVFICPGGKADNLELIWVFIDDLNGLGANGPGGSQDDDSAHLPILPRTPSYK